MSTNLRRLAYFWLGILVSGAVIFAGSVLASAGWVPSMQRPAEVLGGCVCLTAFIALTLQFFRQWAKLTNKYRAGLLVAALINLWAGISSVVGWERVWGA